MAQTALIARIAALEKAVFGPNGVRLREADDIAFALSTRYKLPRMQVPILRHILTTDIARRIDLIEIMDEVRGDEHDNPDALVKVYVSMIRKRLKADGMTIHAVHRVGYYMDQHDKANLREILGLDPA